MPNLAIVFAIQSPALHIFVSRICLFCQIFKKEDSSLTVHLIDLVFLSFISVSELVHLYAVFFGQLRNRRMKIDIFDLHQKRNHIAGRTASETVKKLFTFRDNKRRCLFIVKRTEPLMASAGSLEFERPTTSTMLHLLLISSAMLLPLNINPPHFVYSTQKLGFLYFFNSISKFSKNT